MIERIKEIYAYREMIFSLVRRDLKGRYKGSALGFFWTFLNPLLQLVVYTIVFSIILRQNIEQYYIFLFVALVPWLFFSTCISGGASCIIDQQNLVKKIYFPREVLPLAYVTSQFVNMILTFMVILVVILVSGRGLNPRALACLPVVMIVEYVLALGFCMLVCAAAVYLRDIVYTMGIITMAWQFLTPVMYSSDIVPEELQPVFKLNPMTSIIDVYRDILYYGRMPKLGTLLLSTVVGVAALVIGWLMFDRLQRGFAEEM